MNNDDDLLKQLNQLPSEAKAPDRWSQIEQAVQTEKLPEKQKQRSPSWWTFAVAASALLIAALSPLYFNQSNLAEESTSLAATDTTENSPAQISDPYLLTIGSLQQANAYYYAKLGYQLKHGDQVVSVQTLDSLKSLRQAQSEYRKALSKKPQSERIQERLFWLYQKERHLLRQLVV